MATATTTAVSTAVASNSNNGKFESSVKHQPSDPTKQPHKPRRRQRQADNDVLENLKRSSTKNDLIYLTKILAPSVSISATRLKAQQHVERLVSLLQGPGENYEICDASLKILGGIDLSSAPLELVIIDRGRTDGFRPDHGDAALPPCYDAISFARSLANHGIDGYFEDYNILSSATNSSYIHRVTWEANGIVPPYTSLAKHHSVLEPVIIIPQLFPSSPSLHIHLAHPSNPHRLSFIKEHMRNVESLPLLTSSLWLWCQSTGIAQLPPITCALLAIQHVQALHGYPKPSMATLSESALGSSYEGFWQRFPSADGTLKYSRAPLIKAPTERRNERDLHIASLLYHMFRSLSQDSKSKSSIVFSIREGSTVPRTSPLVPVATSPKLNSRKNSPNKSFVHPPATNERTSPNGETQPFFWQHQAFVAQDPFVPLQNITNIVDKATCKTLTVNATSAASSMKRGDPFFAILGQEFIKKLKAAPLSGSSQSRQLFYDDKFFIPRITHSDIRVQRSRIIQQVQDVLQQKYGRGYTVECFGSTRYGVDSATSDLDLVIIDHDRIDGFSPSVIIKELPEIYDIQSLAKSLRLGRFIVQQKVPKASVPIVKFTDPRTGICCDVNVNDQLGIFNTQLISRYCELSSVLRPLLMAIKYWAKPLGFNNPSARFAAASFSSYSLALMTIAFLQTRQLLPNMQGDLEKLPPSSVANSYVEGTFWLRSRNNVRQRCDKRFNRLEGWKPSADIKASYGEGDVGKALYEWFKFFGYEHNYAENLLSIQHGGLVRRVGAAISDSASRRSEARKRRKAKLAEQKSENVNGNLISEDTSDEKSPSITGPEVMESFIKSVREVQNGVAALSIDDSSVFQLPAHLDAPTVSLPTANFDVDGAGPVDDILVENEAVDNGIEESGDAEGDAEAVQDAALEYDFNDIDLPAGKQPGLWIQQKLVVSDPFIPSKNCTGAINKSTIERFIQECRRAAFMMEMGCSFADLIGLAPKDGGMQNPSQSKQRRPHSGGNRGNANARIDSRLRNASGRPRSART